MTIEEFEDNIEIFNGRGDWFRIEYVSEYKNKSIKLETKKKIFLNTLMKILKNVLKL